jgi:AcrR family transcriptional regulator
MITATGKRISSSRKRYGTRMAGPPLLTRDAVPPARMARADVAASQRARLLRATAEVAGEAGYAATTVGAVVARAGVSRKTFYEHFDNLEACFLAAYDATIETLRAGLSGALDTELSAREQGRRLLEAYLGLLASEPAIARTYLVEGFSAGPTASERRRVALGQFADIVRMLHVRLREEGEATRELDDLGYELLVGALVFTVTGRVATGEAAALPALAEPLHEFLFTTLGAEA